MEIRLLNTFVTVARLGSFSQAAEQLSYAQSSITSQIQALEGELGVRLFERLGKSISLTAEGGKLLSYAQQILKLCDEARNSMAADGEIKGTLAIGAPESLFTERLMPLFTEFHNRYPDVELSLKFGGSFQFLDLLKNNEIDIAFYIDRKLASQDLVSKLQWPEPIILLAASDNALAHATRVLPEDVAGQLLILSENGCSYRCRFLQILEDAGVTPKSTLESGNVEVMKQLAMSGMGITLLPKVAALNEIAAGKLAELKWAGPAFELMTQIVHHKDKWISPAMHAFITLAGEMHLSEQSRSGCPSKIAN